MDMSFSPEHLAFRDEVRAFIREKMPKDLAAIAEVDGHFDMKDVMRWHKVLFEKGWVAPHWPKEFGGPGWDATRRFVFNEEIELSGAPLLSPFGLVMVGPLIMQFGSDAQKQRFLPKILSGEEVWCQGYSEPNAGSDLASLKTRADDDGKGHFVVNGQKTWTTYAQYADWIFCLVRTDQSAKKQAGISFLLIDCKTPGVTVKPFLTTGNTLAFCETWFENVVVPKENVVGPLNGGWTLAKALLGHERTMIAGMGTSDRTTSGDSLPDYAREYLDVENGLLADPVLRDRISQLEVDRRCFELTLARSRDGMKAGHKPGPETSIFKLYGTELNMRKREMMVQIAGPQGLGWEGEGFSDDEIRVTRDWLRSRGNSIEGGTSEIQLNIIAKRVLGLPD